jgi:hypothetical protein
MPLNVLSEAVAEKTAVQWEQYGDSARRHFEQLKLILDQSESDYRL